MRLAELELFGKHFYSTFFVFFQLHFNKKTTPTQFSISISVFQSSLHFNSIYPVRICTALVHVNPTLN